jgi:hypothetical protein
MYELALSESFTCPRCKTVTRDLALARRGYCGNCRAFTGLCGAASLAVALFATGAVTMPGWPYPCTTAGKECWQWTGADGAVTGVLLCASHGDRLRSGATSWMESRGLKLAFGGTRRSCVRSCHEPAGPSQSPPTAASSPVPKGPRATPWRRGMRSASHRPRALTGAQKAKSGP